MNIACRLIVCLLSTVGSFDTNSVLLVFC